MKPPSEETSKTVSSEPATKGGGFTFFLCWLVGHKWQRDYSDDACIECVCCSKSVSWTPVY